MDELKLKTFSLTLSTLKMLKRQARRAQLSQSAFLRTLILQNERERENELVKN